MILQQMRYCMHREEITATNQLVCQCDLDEDMVEEVEEPDQERVSIEEMSILASTVEDKSMWY